MRALGRSSQQITNASFKLAVLACILFLSLILGYKASLIWLALPALGIGSLVLLREPRLGLMLLTVAAVVGRIKFDTGTAVTLNAATLLVPAMFVIWLQGALRWGHLQLAPSKTNRPLMLFLLAGILSLMIGTATWDPAVPRSSSFVLVQVAQWAIFAFSAMAYWLMGNLVRDQLWLRRIVFLFLGIAGLLAILFVIPGVGVQANRITTGVLNRAPFWMILTALSMGQLLFNDQLTTRWRAFLILILVAVAAYALYWNRDSASTWVAIASVIGILAWLRWPRLRWPVILLLVVLVVSGGLFSGIYEFAGGDVEWERTGGSRLALISRVLEVTLRNPITGLGPAAYRAYGAVEPLPYGPALWLQPQISSHNNYVDLFSHVGVLGLVIFFWFAVEVAKLGLRLRQHFTQGFDAAYVNSMLAAGAGALTLMAFADWMLPFVYNIGFPGFQASVLVWLFMGGLLALEQMVDRDIKSDPVTEHWR